MVGIERYLDSTVPLRITFISGVPDPKCTKKEHILFDVRRGNCSLNCCHLQFSPFHCYCIKTPGRGWFVLVLTYCMRRHDVRESNRERHKDQRKDEPNQILQEHIFGLFKKIKSHVSLKSRKLLRPISQMVQSQGEGVLPYNLSMHKDLLLKVGLFSFSQTDYGFLPVQHWIRLYTSPKSSMNLILVSTGVSGHATTTCPLEAKLQSNLTQSLTQERDWRHAPRNCDESMRSIRTIISKFKKKLKVR